MHNPARCPGLVLEPLPVGAWAFLSVATAIATKTLSFPAAFSAFTNDVIWLIVVSFFFARVSSAEGCPFVGHEGCFRRHWLYACVKAWLRVQRVWRVRLLPSKCCLVGCVCDTRVVWIGSARCGCLRSKRCLAYATGL
jgi:hypothetical protein